MSSRIMGINVCNPVDVCKEYLLYTVDYARKAGLNHIQINGPIHDSVKGNIDGMTKLVKYADFNSGKDEEYIKKASDAVNTACDRAEKYGIKVYVWHHELELPRDFKKRFPQILNSYGDIELTHPLVRDFLDNKIGDFFAQYPKVSGIVLTLHETSVPILKLKEQKLEEKERVEYVTRIIFEACERLGKELIVRPFASIEKDYEIMAAAYGRISKKLSVMDKWTQFDWSLTAPDNPFFSKITKNPLLVEADIFGEFFGRNYFPMMLKKHIEKKVEYCEKFAPVGYVARIDRNGAQPFGDINEVNLVIMNSLLKGLNPDSEIDRFFNERFGAAAAQMRKIMEKTEDVLKKILYLNGFYFNSQSFFPGVNHSKNHYYFEILREKYELDSDEWFVPKSYSRGTVEGLIEEKRSAVREAEKLLDEFTALEKLMPAGEYEKNLPKFKNLLFSARAWGLAARIIMAYAAYFETHDEACADEFEKLLGELEKVNREAIGEIGKAFIGTGTEKIGSPDYSFDFIGEYIKEIKASFLAERKTDDVLRRKNAYDYVICGGGSEWHRLKKEVNFSDTLVTESGTCRTCGSLRAGWCSINAHGWFSYRVKVKPNVKNIIKVTAAALNADGCLDMAVTIGENSFSVHEKNGALREYALEADIGAEEYIRIKFDKISECTPCVYTIGIYA